MKSYSVPTNFTNAAYFYPDNTGQVGTLQKSPMAATLVTFDYSQSLLAGVTLNKVAFILDVQTTPMLLISNSNITANVLTFIASGGWSGVTYNLTVQGTLSNTTVRTDVLTLEVMGEDMRYDPCCPPMGRPICPSPIPKSYNQALLSSSCSSYKSGCITYYICDTPPVNPNIMDQWFNTTNQSVQEYLTDGVNFWWQPFQVAVSAQSTALYYLATANQTVFYTLTPDVRGKSAIIPNVTGFVQVYVNGVRLVRDVDYVTNVLSSTVTLQRPIPVGDVVVIDIMTLPNI